MSDRGSSEKSGLALFCVFMTGWALYHAFSPKPAARVDDDSIPFARHSSRPYSPASVAPPADGGPVMTPPEPAFKRDAVSLLSRPSGVGAPPAMMDEIAAGPARGATPASASAAVPRAALNGTGSWQMGAGSGGARPTASVMPGGGAAPPAATGASRSASSAPPASRSVAGAGAGAPAAASRSMAGAPAAGASPEAAGGPGGPGGPPAGGAVDPLAAAAAGAPKPSISGAGPAAPANDVKAASSGSGGGSGGGGGGGGGGGDAGGGGGGGAGGGSGISGGPTAQKPQGSAGPPGGGGASGGPAAAAAGGPSGGGGGGGGGASSDGDQPPIADVKPQLAEPQLESPKPTGEAFALHPNQPPSVPIIVDPKTGAVKFMAKMAIDVDGSSGQGAFDRTNQLHHSKGDQTAGHYANGKPLNATVTPFIVVPGDMGHGIRVGDFAAVTYGGRTIMAVVGDVGPKGVVGEASPAVARPLGIPADANNGGVGNGVTYVILPGSGSRAIPDTAAQIDAAARAAFAKKGIPIR